MIVEEDLVRDVKLDIQVPLNDLIGVERDSESVEGIARHT